MSVCEELGAERESSQVSGLVVAAKPLSITGKECRRLLEGEGSLLAGVGRGHGTCVGGGVGRKLRGMQSQRKVRRARNPGQVYLSRTLLGSESQVTPPKLTAWSSACSSTVRCRDL